MVNINQINCKSEWFVQTPSRYKICLYEDIFIRKYITSFFFKWSKLSTFKVIGSIYLNRTFGRIYVKILFFYPNNSEFSKYSLNKTIQKTSLKKLINTSEVQPFFKCKKHLLILNSFFQLEKILGVQILFKYVNICTPKPNYNLIINNLINFLLRKLSFFRLQFKGNLYQNTINFFVHLFKFKNPDSLLFANYLSFSLRFVHRHTYFLIFLQKILQTIIRVFNVKGVRILLSGKLNGLSRAQVKQIQVGTVFCQSSSIPCTYGFSESFTKFGKIGIKVIIC